MGGLSVPFEANSGQWDAQVAFKAQTFAGQVFVTHGGNIVYSLPGPVQDQATAKDKTPATKNQSAIRAPGWSLVETLVGAAPLAPSGTQAAPTHISRFQGNSSYRAATYHSVHLGQAWPGVAVELSARGNNVEKLFHVAPGANAGQIQVQLQGAKALRLGEQGQLIATTGHGEVAYTAPVAYQTINNQRIDIPVRYVLSQGKGKQHSYQFALGDYDRSAPLVIDPLIQSTYLGGSSGDFTMAMAMASNGDVLVAGYTESTNFPGTTGGAQATYGGGQDAFVSRLSGDLKTLIQSTYLGGSALDTIMAMVLDSSNGDVLVAGATGSINFPGTSGGAQEALRASNGSFNNFVARLSGDLTQLKQSTYLGGSYWDQPHALTVASNGDVLVVGEVASTDFPGTTDGAQATKGSLSDAFVSRLSGDLKHLIRSTYLGGSGGDSVYAMAVASNGDVLVTGLTDSTDLPGVTGGAAQAANGGGYDVFVSRLSGDLRVLQQSTYLGGSDSDVANALAVASNGDVLVAGYTASTNFPGTTGGAQAARGADFGGSDAFVTRLSGDLTTLQQSTYLGGSSTEYANALAVASNDDVLVAGYTRSSNFPGTTGGAQAAHAGGYDTFVSRLSGDLTTLQQSTYLGGSGYDIAQALAVASNGDVLVAGYIDSTNFPGTTGGAQATHAADSGGSDAFVSRLTGDLKAVSPQTITFGAQPSQTFAPSGTFSLSPVATASSGLPVSYSSLTTSVCTISGTTPTVTMVSAGTCTIQADQAGDASWQAAMPVSQSVTLAAPAATAPTPIPVNAPWALLLATLGLAGLGMRGLRGRQ